MSRIRVLAAAVADQIAAGEVVERPASVVKELVENSLDAGATRVDVAIEDGGRALIRIADDGSGMDRDDAVLALSRHATSKIERAEQLVGVRSFGFRGEALPAIASVSELRIETAPANGAGTAVVVRGGALLEVADVARQRGTTVSVQQLFYNTPARRKFLKGARSEWRAILDAMHAIAVLRRDVRFTLSHDGRVALDLPAAASLRERLAVLWGASDVSRFVDVDDVQGPVHVRGLVERPADVGTAGRRVLLMVNGRVIRDPGLVRAAEAAYKSTIPSGVRPSLVLDLHIPGDDVDVNVHPAKAEVRFRDRWPIERVVEGAVRRALGLFDASASVGWRRWTPGGLEASRPMSGLELLGDSDTQLLTGHPTTSHAQTTGLFAPHVDVAPAFDDAPWPAEEHAARVGAPAPAPAFGARAEGVTETAATAHAIPAHDDARTPIVVPPLLQLRRTWMLFEHEDGVVLIDQHSAHERVLYERFLGVLARGEAPSQRLLLPITLHLTPAEAEAFEAHREAFTALGFEADAFGGHALLVQAVPMPHPRFDAERCLRESLAALTGDRRASAHTSHERLAATVACKAAVKAGDSLSPGEMRALFEALARTTLPAHDVHGRATIVRLSWDELERRFGRT
ncbi:MAG: DNA mismatch repair endonuclease MutL [Gemmatimonadetes bacterium]|nr:DNA mismatch repair endonuclease MutL [Gemmatimonadota bacterium]